MSVDHDILTEDAQTPAELPARPGSGRGPRRSRHRRSKDGRSDERRSEALGYRTHRSSGHLWQRGGLGSLGSLLRRDGNRPRVRLRKLRLLLILGAFGVLALISALFGMLTSVASDLPQLANSAQFKSNVESYMYDETGQPIGPIAPPTEQVIDQWKQISPNMVHAIISVEDKRFWTDPGVDIRGIARAFVADVTGGPTQGASTIAEQFVKNALLEQNNRTIFEKLREAALAFQLVHRWKRTRILTSYLNTIYFGHGAVGIESAARVYFGWNHGYDAANPGSEPPGACGDPTASDPHRPECAQVLYPWEAAMLAGIVANPTAFDPIANPGPAMGRRNQVLQLMLSQHYITHAQYEVSIHEPLPKASQIQQPQEPAQAPYFTSWVRPQIVAALEHEGVPAKVAQYRAYYGGLRVRLTINLKMQQAAQQAVDAEFPPGSNGPTASLVAIDNRTGEVRAMVSGSNGYAQAPFNLATMGYRQPGSAFKVFTLAAALTSGKYGPDSIIDSAPQDIPFRLPNGKIGHFRVHNYGNIYSGPITLSQATAVSDNSVFSQVGMHVGTKRIRFFAKRMGIRSPVSTNPSMILGGLATGVSALDMAHAYETVATGGLKVYNPILGDIDGGPIGIHSILCPACRHHFLVNHPTMQRVLPASVATTMRTMLEGPVSPGGTAPVAAIPGVLVAGKTGTTTNEVDAWFVGWTPQLTVAVWVGFPNSAKPMTTLFNGGPVEGGTYPAIIWKNFMLQALQILAGEHAPGPSTLTTTTPAAVTPTLSTPTTPAPGAGTGAAAGTTGTPGAAGTTGTPGGAAGTSGTPGGAAGTTGTGTPGGTTGTAGGTPPPSGGGAGSGTGGGTGSGTGGSSGGAGTGGATPTG
ncbi:MAG TPA: transglycosylase domain-containing protein [Solirubrobacteraceae bacterium]|nr:transglycosylase domain-containing protein [Solirubrobacteraceae bacterium]